MVDVSMEDYLKDILKCKSIENSSKQNVVEPKINTKDVLDNSQTFFKRGMVWF